jgi:hypothetical protein
MVSTLLVQVYQHEQLIFEREGRALKAEKLYEICTNVGLKNLNHTDNHYQLDSLRLRSFGFAYCHLDACFRATPGFLA